MEIISFPSGTISSDNLHAVRKLIHSPSFHYALQVLKAPSLPKCPQEGLICGRPPVSPHKEWASLIQIRLDGREVRQAGHRWSGNVSLRFWNELGGGESPVARRYHLTMDGRPSAGGREQLHEMEMPFSCVEYLKHHNCPH
ncbi:hypothetical protein AVEN_213008-1 [Araneus ventricosus]|uniref:Uncharacterized protein n=1 Tax=Araneus ventricosus TaxID=182803 RepID=A0A4Y2JUY8_ARAVE|nr:hypothetical protein AVEN_213008-1 [Araneus ventricosus]